ncbi:MAG: YitT family protein [Traorella sp.]
MKEAAMICIISVYVSSVVIDKTLSFDGQKTKSIMIVTNKYEEILKEILVDVDRGATLIHSEGGYSREFRYVIMCVIENKQYPKLNALINEIDPNAFIVVQDAQEVRGNGFTYYTELRRKALKK